MARDAVTPVTLVANSGNLEGAGTAITAANGMDVDCTNVKNSRLVIRIKNTFAGSKVATIKAAGVNPPAFRKDLGDLAVTLASQNDIHTLVLESSRFVGQSGSLGHLYIDFAASMTGTVWVYNLPLP